MQAHNDNRGRRRRQETPDPLRRSMRRDRAGAMARDYARELRAERRAVELDRFWDRRYA